MAVIIGSSAGASLLATCLVRAGIPTTILEKEENAYPKDEFNYYDNDISQESDLISMMSVSESVENQLKGAGIDISKEINEVRDLINSRDFESKTADSFTKACKSKALSPKKVSKASIDCLDFGVKYGLTVINEVSSIELIADDKKIIGVKYVKDGLDRIAYSKTVILCSGTIESAMLLRSVGIQAGEEIYCNPASTVGGIIKGIELNKDVQLSVVAKNENYFFLPYFSQDIKENLRTNAEDVISLIVKSSKPVKASLDEEGNITLDKDDFHLDEGIQLAEIILEKMGALKITSTDVKLINPCGSATIGGVVDKNLETKKSGLFVCDLSVLSSTNETPSLLPLLALSKRLANYLESVDYDNNRVGKSDYGLGKSYGLMSGWLRPEYKPEN